MSAPPTIVRRIVLRLDPARPHDSALARALHLAKAFRAELAARMIADTRFAEALAFAGLPSRPDAGRDIEKRLRRAESSLRRELSMLAVGESPTWSFEVVRCAGVLAHDGDMAPDDFVALEVPTVETSIAEFRAEVASTLAHARGVLLFPAAANPARGPVAAVVGQRSGAKSLIEHGRQIAAALGVPLKILEQDGQSGEPERERREAGDIATAVRRLGATLAVIDASDPVVNVFLARPRHLREIGAPLLLLKAAV